MKKSFVRMMTLLAVFAVSFAFTSCSDDDDTPATYSIVGSWTEEASAGSNMTFDFTFKSNGTGKFVVTYVTDYTINGVDTESDEYDFEYTISSDGGNQYITFLWENTDEDDYSILNSIGFNPNSNRSYLMVVTKTSLTITVSTGYYKFTRL